jgi:hypothetical protein
MTWQEYAMRTPVLEDSLVAAVHQRLQGRLLDFSIEERPEGLVLRGLAHSYHVKQLAQLEVARLTRQIISANRIEVRPRVAISTMTVPVG